MATGRFRLGHVQASSLALLAVPLMTGCPGPTDCCIDPSSSAVLEGFVVDGATDPVEGARLEVTGERSFCTPPGVSQGFVGGEATTDSVGWFRLRLESFLGPPGLSCLDVVTWRDSIAADTTHGVQVEFFLGSVLDTARVILRP